MSAVRRRGDGVEGMNICGKCRWSHGCLSCNMEKAWDWALRVDLSVAGPKPKAKAKAKAKVKGEAKAKTKAKAKVKGGGGFEALECSM